MKLNNQQGFTIVELMVAATLGLLILAGTVTMFVNNKRLYQDQQEIGRLQENARYAMDMLTRELRLTGHVGCLGDPALVNNNLKNAFAGFAPGGANDKKLGSSDDAAADAGLDTKEITVWTPSTIVEGSENGGNWQPSNSTQVVGNMVAGSDALTLRFMEPTDFYPMNPPVASGGGTLRISAQSGLNAGDIVALADCDALEVVQITGAVAASGCTPSSALSTGPDDTCLDTAPIAAGTVSGIDPGNIQTIADDKFDSTAKFYRFRTHRYFVGVDPNGNTVLYRKSDNSAGPGDIIVDGIENMQVMYGEDTDNDQSPDIYRDASAVVNWPNVVAVRIALLVRTELEYGPEEDTKTYDLLGTTVNPTDDRRQRQVATTTVLLRNVELFQL